MSLEKLRADRKSKRSRPTTTETPELVVRAAPPMPATPAEQPEPPGKLAMITGLLEREGGATIADLTSATGWQAHSIRGAIAGALKKTRKLNVVSEKAEAGRVYKIVTQ